MELPELVEHVKDAAVEVYRTLGDGRIESVYEQAMAVEFRQRGIPYQMEVYTEVFYKGERVGTAALDFVVDGQLVVELKALGNLGKPSISQTQAYMRETGIDDGILINFPYPAKDEPQIEVLEVDCRGSSQR